MVTKKTLSLLNTLRDFQLSEILISPVDWSTKLIFTFGSNPEIKDVSVQLSKIVHMTFSKDPDDNEGCYTTYEVKLNPIHDGGNDILSLLNYPIRSRDGNVFSYPSKMLFHFHLEGDICIEAVCEECKAYEV